MRPSSIAVLCLVATALAYPAGAGATTLPSPKRPLTEAELTERAAFSSDAIVIARVWGGRARVGAHLLFLKTTPGGCYVVLRSGAGFMKIEGERVVPLQMSLATVRRRIAAFAGRLR